MTSLIVHIHSHNINCQSNRFCFTQKTVGGFVLHHADPPSSGGNDSSFDVTCHNTEHTGEPHLHPRSEPHTASATEVPATTHPAMGISAPVGWYWYEKSK